MDLERALRLKIGERVACPLDRGDSGFMGTVTNVSPLIHMNVHGSEYIWVQVMTPFGRRSVWPSNRLGTTIGAARDACLGVAA